MSDEIKVIGPVRRRSPFDTKMHGIKPDPGKDRRWVDPKRIEERKHGSGYETVKPAETGVQTADRTVRTKGGMVLMERPIEKAIESQKEKEAFTRSRTQAAQEQMRDRVEDLSRKYGKNLHKVVYEDEG